jgi:enoyl-CoA hydratase/carnithine racemase
MGTDSDSCAVLRLDLALAGRQLSPPAIERLSAAVSSSNARAIVIESSAPAFCEGLDIDVADLAGGSADPGVTAFGELLDLLEGDGRPVIAVVAGAAKGGGVGLAAVADLVIATEDASFGLPEALIGLLPAVIFPFVARRIGVARARWLALSGESFDAQRAAACGLVDHLTDEPRALLDRLLRRLCRMDQRAQAEIKRLVARHFAAPSAYRGEAVASFTTLFASPGCRARVRRLRNGWAPWDESVDG